MSRLDLIAGPNGAGKSTLFDAIIHPERPGLPFVNADLIARHRFPGAEADHAVEAARIADEARRALIDARLDFCTETVFSHVSTIDLVAAAVDAAYDVVLHVVMIPFELSPLRVAARLNTGGHDVPTDKLRSRFERLWPLLVDAVPMCRRSVFYDNAYDDGPHEVAVFRFGVADHPPRWPMWTPEPLRALG